MKHTINLEGHVSGCGYTDNTCAFELDSDSTVCLSFRKDTLIPPVTNGQYVKVTAETEKGKFTITAMYSYKEKDGALLFQYYANLPSLNKSTEE